MEAYQEELQRQWDDRWDDILGIDSDAREENDSRKHPAVLFNTSGRKFLGDTIAETIWRVLGG